MNSSVMLFGFLFGLMFFVATTSARPNHSESDLSNFDEEREVDYGITRNREHSRRGQRRRHSRQISNRYDYFSPSFYDITRELYTIREQMNELANSIKSSRSPPAAPAYSGYPPQYIFIPILLPALGSSCSCNNSNNVPNVGNRINDDVPIWGGSNKNGISEEDDDNDVGRPISFQPVNVNKPQGRPPPPVEHGSIQAGLSTSTTTATTTTATPKKLPSICEAAILSCCRFGDDQKKQCFQQYGCMKTYNTGLACTPRAIQVVIQRFRDAYAPS